MNRLTRRTALTAVSRVAGMPTTSTATSAPRPPVSARTSAKTST